MIRTSTRPTIRPALLMILSAGLAAATAPLRAELPVVPPGQLGLSAEHLQRIDAVVDGQLRAGNLPGCVVAIGRTGGIGFLKAYGRRQIEPSEESMTTDTLFDMASLTKPVATAASVMILVERGQVRLRNPVADYLPDFGANGKDQITVEDLLIHRGGLIPDNSLADYRDGPEKAWERIYALEAKEPGERFVYSDVGYLVLGKLVNQVSGQTIAQFAKENIFQPLGMEDTGFTPDEALRRRAAPTEQRDGNWLRGVVHDPRAALLDGVAGHAGLFSTAADLALYCDAMLRGARWGDGQSGVMSRATLAEMLRPRDVAGNLRALGWDVRSGYSTNRGELFSERAFGHGGFTGTAMWIDPKLDLFVIFLSNRLHPDGQGNVNPLAGRIGAIAAAAIVDRQGRDAFATGESADNVKRPVAKEFRPLSRTAQNPPPSQGGARGGIEQANQPRRSSHADRPVTWNRHASPAGDHAENETPPEAEKSRPLSPSADRPSPSITPAGRGSGSVLTGIDVLVRDDFKPLQGRRVGLITNHTGLSRDGQRTVDLLHQADGLELVALFSPEHGIAGKLDREGIGDEVDAATGLKVFSLYDGPNRRPKPEQLEGLDTLVFDIQDVGARFYTYASTMGWAMETAALNNLRFVVLDRPNPIGGLAAEGPLADGGRESFVGFHTIPVRHGMTVGELAEMYRAERDLKVDLEVVKCDAWRRRDYWDATGLAWVNPSPNMRSLAEAVLYPGMGLWETTNLSVGRGTDTPFEVLGAPWIDARQFAAELNAAGLPGVRFVPIQFTPEASKYSGEKCGGVNVIVVNRAKFEPIALGLELACTLRRLYKDQWQTDAADRLLINQQAYDAILSGKSRQEIQKLYKSDLEEFLKRREKFLLYHE